MNNIFDDGLGKSFEELDLQFADYHTSAKNCICNPYVEDNYLVHFWVGEKENHPKQTDSNQ